MTCGPLSKDQVLELYSDILIEITDRIKNPDLGKFDVDSYMKDLYVDLYDSEDPASEQRAKLYVQTVPTIIEKILADTQHRQIKEHFIKQLKGQRDRVEQLAFEFTDPKTGLNEVAKFLKKTKIKPEFVSAAIKTIASKKGAIKVLTYRDEKGSDLFKWSKNNDRLKPVSSFTLTGQEYYPLNPADLTEEQRNALRDPSKALFYDVISKLVLLAKNKKVSDTTVNYQGTDIMLRPIPSKNIPEDQLTNELKDNLKKNKIINGIPFRALHNQGMVAALADSETGEILYFNESGDIVEEGTLGARMIYQPMRKVLYDSEKDQLLLSNNSNYYYTLVSPKDIAEARKNMAIAAGEIFTDEDFENVVKVEEARIKDEVNTLYNLRNFVLSNPEEILLLPVENGSFGFVNDIKKGIPLKNTKINPDSITSLKVDPIDGTLSIRLENFDDIIYAQRSNMPKYIADKVAEIITTDAKFPNGQMLSPAERLMYVRTFLGPTPQLANYTVIPVNISLETEEGVEILSVVINGEPIDPFEEGAAEFISDSLMNMITGNKIDPLTNKNYVFSAPLNYSNDYVNSTYADYDIENGIIIERELPYNDYIKDYLLVSYDPVSAEFVKGANAYLSFSVSEEVKELITPEKEKTAIRKRKEDSQDSTLSEEDVTETVTENYGNITINVSGKSGYDGPVEEAMKQSSVIISISENFTRPTQEKIKNLSDELEKEYYGQSLAKKGNAYSLSSTSIRAMVEAINKSDGVIYIGGDNINELKTNSQKTVDNFMERTLKEILESPYLKVDIVKIVNNGQTGISEAIIKAADKFGVNAEIIASKDYIYRQLPNKIQKKKLPNGVDVKNNEALFKKRFGIKSTAKKSKTVSAEELTEDDIIALTITPVDSVDATQRIKEKIKKRIDELERSKSLDRFIDSVFVTDVDKKKALDWFNNESGLAPHISLERITAIVNSNAFAKWSVNGITLYEGDGGTDVDLYHEAYHGFSQLFLTIDQKISLYKEVASRPKWKNKKYEDPIDLYREVEEEIAEDFRSFMVFKKRFPGVMGRIFEKIASAIRKLFSKITKRDFLKPRDIESVREIFEKLHKGEILDLKPSQDNILFKGEDLYRSKPAVPALVKTAKDEFTSFTSDEAEKLKVSMDNIMASIIGNYNRSKNTTSGVARLLHNENNRKSVYGIILDELTLKAEELAGYFDEYQKTVLENADPDNKEPDFKKEALLQEYVDKYRLLEKAIANFGDIEASLDGKQKTGLVYFHLENTRFNIIKDTYLEMADDPSAIGQTTAMLQAVAGNIKSSKEIANEDTWMVISSIFKPDVDEDGNYIMEVDEDGIENNLYVKDYFGFDSLESADIIWNKLARTMAGSLTPRDIWNKLKENEENYPEFKQIQKLLPAPSQDYTDKQEFDTETKFWQDFKKPRIPYLQLTVNKEPVENSKNKFDYSSLVGEVSFDVYRVTSDWEFAYKTFDEDINTYIVKDALLRNTLDTEAIIENFSTSNGKFDITKSLEFLDTLGIILDTSSIEIRSIVNKKTFAGNYGLDLMFEAIKIVDEASKSTDDEKVAAAINFKVNPIEGFKKGLPNILLPKNKTNNYEVATRLRVLAELQNRYSNEYSNFSVQSPENNRVWEHFLDSTLTRSILSINSVEDFRMLTDGIDFDPNGEFKHMRWLADENNPHIKFSQIINSLFYMDKSDPKTYGKRRNFRVGKNNEEENKILIKNVAGTQILNTVTGVAEGGVNTSSADSTTKFLQEMNTMLLYGIQEFMRHASKQMAQGIRAEKVNTYKNKEQGYLYVDVKDFKPSKVGYGQQQAFDIILGYIAGEHERIKRFNSNIDKYSKWKGYNRKVRKKDGSYVYAAQVFTAFDDVLTEDVKERLYAVNYNLSNLASADMDLYELVKRDVDNYFEKLTDQNNYTLQNNRYVDPQVYDLAYQDNLTRGQIDRVLSMAYTYNSWIHNYETVILSYGDLVQYNHAKEEFHKRNAGLTSPGKGFRADLKAQDYINRVLNFDYAKKNNYKMRLYDGTLHTAILREKVLPSKYYNEYKDALEKDYLDRFKNNKTMSAKEKKAEAKRLAEIEMKEYLSMKEADGQGHITLEAYKMLKSLEGNWLDPQEKLYQDIIAGKEVGVSDILEYFPPYKLQYYGNIDTTGLSLVSFHKFSLAPLIPSVTGTSKLTELHRTMMENQVDYVLYDSGSKVGHINESSNELESGDVIFDEDGNIIEKKDKPLFTKNIIFAEFLKNQTEVNSHFKAKSIFSTQMRKLVLEGLYEQGIIQSTKEDEITIPTVKRYLKNVDEYSELLKNELLNQIGYRTVEKDGKLSFEPIDKNSLSKLVDLIKSELVKDDTLGNHLVSDFIQTYETSGKIVHDLSFHPEASKIEKLVLSLINKRLIKQKVKGEPLVQVSASMYEGIFGSMVPDLKKATDAEVKKFVGSNFLPTYHRKPDGKTAAMKVMVALQGDFEHLLNLKDLDGNIIGSIDRLNELIKNDEWLDKDNNRKSVTMVGVRIPVQGLNSMEFMEVYHFLPAEAGNIIVPPSEIVAKSGADFDIDKLTIYMPNIYSDGTYSTREVSNEEFNALVNGLPQQERQEYYDLQKRALENELIEDIRNILELPQNYASLIRPNGTYILQPIAKSLAEDVSDYDMYANISSDTYNLSEKGEKIISPTRVLEAGYNLYKHESNAVGKRTLGLGAVENTFNVLFNSIGYYMPQAYLHSDDSNPRLTTLFMRHNRLVNDEGENVISLSNRYDVDHVNKIADLFSQAINGWVDVEKDAWIFFIQGNYEVASTLLYLLKAGVPVEDAIYFVSHPLVRDYVTEIRRGRSKFAGPLGVETAESFVKSSAANRVLSKYFGKTFKTKQFYYEREKLSKKLGEVTFDKENLTPLIKAGKKDKTGKVKNPAILESDFSLMAFLHFLEIEQQITGVKRLKLNNNPDTSLKTNFSEVEQSEASLENLEYDTKIPQKMRKKLKEDSIISSFNNNELALSMIRPLMPLRYHNSFSNWIKVHTEDFKDAVGKLLPFENVASAVDVFRNDFILFVLQDTLKNYAITDTYKSINMSASIPTKKVAELTRGAFVANNSSGEPTLYLDIPVLKQQYKYEMYKKNAGYENDYEDLNLYPLSKKYFQSYNGVNEATYISFVAQREYLRYSMPIETVKNREDYKKSLTDIKREYPKMTQEATNKMAYEKFIAMKALDDTFNSYKLFKDSENSYAIKMANLLNKKYMKSLKLKFEVLQKIKVDESSDGKMTNVYINDKDYTSAKSDLYYKNIRDLANPAIMKVSNAEENRMISELFSIFPIISLMQTGFNKTKLNSTNVIDLTMFLDLVESRVPEINNIFENEEKTDKLLRKFFSLYKKMNSSENPYKARFKDFFMQNGLEEYITNDAVITREGLTETLNPNIFTYTSGKPEHYKNLVKNNPDVVFTYGLTELQIDDPKKVFSNESRLREYTDGIFFMVGLKEQNDNFFNVPRSEYNKIKASFDESIQKIEDALSDNMIVAFPVKGFGDVDFMPEELFVYLSKRLYETFRYINPGSTIYNEVLNVVEKGEGISNRTVNELLNTDEDPFKCAE
jgi:hypothetical protein